MLYTIGWQQIILIMNSLDEVFPTALIVQIDQCKVGSSMHHSVEGSRLSGLNRKRASITVSQPLFTTETLLAQILVSSEKSGQILPTSEKPSRRVESSVSVVNIPHSWPALRGESTLKWSCCDKDS